MRLLRTRTVILSAFIFIICAPRTTFYSQTAETPTKSFAKAPEHLSKIRSELIERLKENKEPSFAVAVVRVGKVIWGETLGWADREAGIPARPDTRYAVASVSKSITATGALALAARGMLDLNSGVEKILGSSWVASNGERQKAISVVQLLNHTSGIPHLWHYEYQDRPETVIGTDALIRRYAGAVTDPGGRYLYTNLGFGVLARIVGKVGGDSFETAMNRQLFGPLKMNRTTTKGWLADKGYVRGYSEESKPIPYRFRLAPDGGAGYFTTLEDMTNYVLFHLGEGSFSKELRSVSISGVINDLPAGRFSYKRGWGIVRLPDSTVLISDGQMAGGTAAIVLIPEKRIGVVVMCNQTGPPSDGTAVKILAALVEGFESEFGAAIEEIEKEIGTPVEMPKGLFEGTVGEGDRSQEILLDTSDIEAPVVTIRGNKYLLQKLEWERGTLLATAVGTIPFGAGKGRTHNLNFTFWPEGNGIGGFVQEEITDERPGSGLPFRMVLKPRK